MCAEYRIRESEKEVDFTKLLPWVRCSQQVFLTHSLAKEDEAFALFFRELSAFETKHLRKIEESIVPVDWNAFLPTLLSWISDQSNQKIDIKQHEAIIIRNLPEYSLYLLKRGLLSRSAKLDAKSIRPEIQPILKARREGLTSERLEKSLRYWKAKTFGRDQNRCLASLGHQADLFLLEELETYRNTLEPSMMRLRVDGRIDSLVQTIHGRKLENALARCLR